MSATGELFPHQPEIARYYNHGKKKTLRHSRAGKTVDLWASVAKCSQMVSSPLGMCVEPKKIKAKPEGKKARVFTWPYQSTTYNTREVILFI